MQIQVDEELRNVLQYISKANKTEKEWALVESDDMLQFDHYVGGYDATENAFCFSYYKPDGQECWFQFTLEEVAPLLSGQRTSVEARAPSE